MSLHVSSTMCSSSGGQNCIIQPLVLSHPKICFTISLFHASTCFEHHLLIVGRLKLYYTASGIITPKNLFYNKFISCLYMFRAPCAHRQEVKTVLCSLWYYHTYRYDNTMCSSSAGQNCIIQPMVLYNL